MHDLTLQNMLKLRKNNFELREHLNVQDSEGVLLRLNGCQYLSFSTNNYLGLAQHPKVIEACQKAFKRFGVGSGSAYLISGYSHPHEELEKKLADFLNYPCVLLFSSGYMANIGILRALFDHHAIFADKLNHASLVDGCLTTKKVFKRYPHRNVSALQKLLEQTCSPKKLIVSEGLFGMDGTIAPLNELHGQSMRHQTSLLIDDAHGIGVLGAQGRGSLELTGLGFNEVPILVGTLGKAFGTYGAFVASNELIIKSLMQLARTYLYTTAIPPALASASMASLEIIKEEPWRREKIQDLTQYFQTVADQLDIDHSFSNTPIQLIMLRNSQKSVAVSQYLYEKGILVKAIRPPTVPRASARLRISITAEHTKQQIDFLLENLKNALTKSEGSFHHGN